MKKQLAAVMVAVMLAAGCASMRGVSVGTDKTVTGSYALRVHNSRSSAIVLTWTGGSGSQALGTLNSGDTQSYTIYGGGSGSVRAVTAGGVVVGTKSVTFGSSGSESVTF